MVTEHSLAAFRLDDEQRARVRNCLTKGGLSLPPDRFAQLIGNVETSIAHFFAAAPEGTFRDAHNALRGLWELSHEDDPPVGVIRARIKALPKQAIEYLDRRARIVLSRRGWGKLSNTPVVEWVARADPSELIRATRVLTAEGGRIVAGRSRGAGKRSGPRLEPSIMDHVRGGGIGRHRGGRPDHPHDQELVLNLANDWLRATDETPKHGRSDNCGFGDLVHSVFQWLDLPDGSADYTLRRYWAEFKRMKARERLQDP